MANILKMRIETANFNRAVGGKLAGTVRFTEDAIVTGTPIMTLTNDNAGHADTNGATRVQWLEYVSGSGTNELLFEYTLAADDVKSGADNDNLTVGLNAVSLNNGTIKDRADADCTITNDQTIADGAGVCGVYTPA